MEYDSSSRPAAPNPSSMDDPEATSSRGEATREALLQAAIAQFSELGYHAASSRKLAAAAGVNQALIGYHFGGKRGLYVAVFEHIGAAMSGSLGPAAAAVQTLMDDGEATRQELLDGLLVIVDRAVGMFTSPRMASWAKLIVREQQNPSEAFDVVWQRFMSPIVGVLCRLLATLRRDSPESPQIRLMALTILGQALVFRIARETTRRLLGWDEIEVEEIAAIKLCIHQNIRAMLAEEHAS